MTDREQAMEEARLLHGRLRLASSVSQWKAFMADALLEAEARGVEWAGEELSHRNVGTPLTDKRAAELRGQKKGGGE